MKITEITFEEGKNTMKCKLLPEGLFCTVADKHTGDLIADVHVDLKKTYLKTYSIDTKIEHGFILGSFETKKTSHLDEELSETLFKGKGETELLVKYGD